MPWWAAARLAVPGPLATLLRRCESNALAGSLVPTVDHQGASNHCATRTTTGTAFEASSALLHLLRAARPSATVSTAVAVLQKGRAAVAFVQEKYRQLRRVAVIEPHVN